MRAMALPALGKMVGHSLNGKLVVRTRLRFSYLRVTALAVNSNGKCAVSGSIDGKLKVWDVTNGVQRYELKGHRDTIRSVAITPDGKRAASASGDRTIKVWDLNKGSEILTLAGHSKGVNSIAITSDGTRAVLGLIR
jgi:WD40 repeat protein